MRKLIALIVLCWVCPSPAASAAWTEVRTPHYVFFGDASRGDMRRIAQRFEQFHAVMQRLLSRASLTFSAPTVVLVFRDSRSFRPYMPLYEGRPVDTAGWAWSGRDMNYVAMNAEGGMYAYPIIFHELTHLITRNLTPNVPTWFAEGVAEYYSSFEMRGDKQAMLGAPLWRHLELLQERFMPLKELLAVDHTSPSYNERDRATVFYAESWAVIHYLRSDERTRDRFADFMKLVDDGLPQEEAVTKGFGMDLRALEKNLREYVRKFRMFGELWTLNEAVTESGFSASDADEVNALPHLAGLLMTSGRLDDAEQRLKSALAAASQSASAHAALAGVHLEQNRAAEAWGILNKDLSYEGFMDHYTMAAALARYIEAVGTTSGEGMRAATSLRDRIRHATADRPDVPEAWRLAAYAHLLADDAPEAKAAINRALALAPANESYRFVLADVLVRQHDFARARNVLGSLMAHGSTAEVRRNARTMMGYVVKYEASTTADTQPAPSLASPSASEMPRHQRVIPVFRDIQPGETRVFGQLNAIECGRGSVTLIVQIGERTLRLAVPSFDRIDFISYRDDLTGEVTCARREPSDPVYLTWRGQDGGATEVRADSAALEFTPRGYRP